MNVLRNTMIKNASVTDFIILGFSNHPNVNLIMFSAFLCVYIVIVLGNILIIVIIYFDPALHTPMYFFLRNLSFLDLSYISVTLPKMLANLLSDNKTISFASCAVQMFFFLFFGITGCFLLACMAFDHYSAICNPLHYTVIMNKRVCIQLTGGSWICGTLVAVGHTTSIFTLPFCGPKVINHFFCDIQQVLKLVCWNTSWIEIQIIVGAVFALMIPLLLTLMSYIYIVSTILKIRSSKGRRKAFSTCSSHLIVVTFCYGTALIMYMLPKSNHSLGVEKLFSLFYTMGITIVNPIIYSFRNKEVKEAFRKIAIKIFLN